MKFLKHLFGLCDHKWMWIKTVNVYETWDGEHSSDENPSFHKLILQCEKCGNLKVRKI